MRLLAAGRDTQRRERNGSKKQKERNESKKEYKTNYCPGGTRSTLWHSA
jgi:hypothetical protein